MPLDAICLQAVVQELKPLLTGQRIDKVQMPARDQAVLTARAGRLLLNAGAGAPRLQMTDPKIYFPHTAHAASPEGQPPQKCCRFYNTPLCRPARPVRRSRAGSDLPAVRHRARRER